VELPKSTARSVGPSERCAHPRMSVVLSLLLCVVFWAHGASCAESWPQWDCTDTPESYATSVGLPYIKQVRISEQCTLDFVLIPAGRFEMGTREATECAKDWPLTELVVGISGCLGVLLLILVLYVRGKHAAARFQFGLRGLIFATVFAALGLGGFIRFLQAKPIYDADLRVAYQAMPGESPQHPVTITHPFYMSRREVSQAEYQCLTGENPSKIKGDTLPVHNVSYLDALNYCCIVSEMTGGLAVRLPTEAEWEYACRAGTKSNFSFGNTMEAYLKEESLTYKRVESGFSSLPNREPHPVGLGAPNPDYSPKKNGVTRERPKM